MEEIKHTTRRRWRKWSPHQVRRSLFALTDCEKAAAERDTTKKIICYIRRLVDAFVTHQCSLMACACAYCALLSLIPLLVVGISALGFFLGKQHALADVIRAIQGYAPHNVPFASEVQTLLTRILVDRRMIGVYGILGLLWAAHQAFLSMQPAMNLVWGVPETRHWARQRLIAFGAALYSIVLLGANLGAIAFFAYLAKYSLPFIPSRVEAWILSALLGIVPMLITTLLFALLYQFLPSRSVQWKAAFLGAGVAALLWQLSLVGFGVYLAHVHSYDRLYGSLGGLVILVVWAYYSMFILLIGAEIAADYETRLHGMRAAEARAHSGADLAAATGRAPNAQESAATVTTVVSTHPVDEAVPPDPIPPPEDSVQA